MVAASPLVDVPVFACQLHVPLVKRLWRPNPDPVKFTKMAQVKLREVTDSFAR